MSAPELEKSHTEKRGDSPDLNKVDSKDDYNVGVHDAPQTRAAAISGGELHRTLKNRHIAMISIGGVIGTGLFLGTAGALANGGPLGLLLGYMVMGSVVYSVMVALGEMISHLPVAGGHITLAARFVDPALAFTAGWNYWYNWTIVLPAELSAAAVLLHYWITSVNDAAWITIFLVIVLLINLGGARVYGEVEFWFASIKVITIVGLIILGIVISAGGGPDGRSIGFQYWRNPGPFVQIYGIQGSLGQFLGFWSVLIQASFSYIGTEITAICAAEAKNPKRNLPKAIRRVYVRILLFYILGTFIIGILVPFNEPRLSLSSGTARSPFVIAINNAGIKGLPSVINAALLTSAWSAASSDFYTSSRALYGLSMTGSAPRFLAKTTSWGLPWPCVVVAFLFSLLSYMSAGSAGAGKVFGYFANMTSVAGLQTWIGIFITYICWHKACKVQGFDRKALPFCAPLQPYLSYYGLFMCIIIVLTNGWSVFLKGHWDNATFITSYLPLALFVLLAVGSKIFQKTKRVKPAEADLWSGSRDAEEEEELPPKNIGERFWRWLM